jgi:hypothetical protein
MNEFEEVEVYEVGSFEVVSGTLRISDPCYDDLSWCSGELPAVNGTWSAMYGEIDEASWGKRVAWLIAYTGPVPSVNFGWFKTDIDVGVDSGQAGIFDARYYRDDELAKGVELHEPDDAICEDEPWYSLCCDRTCNDNMAGIIPYGVVSRSGFGDGGYDCYAIEGPDKKVRAVKIVFIGEDEEDEDDDDYVDESADYIETGSPDWDILEEMVERLGVDVVEDALERIEEQS